MSPTYIATLIGMTFGIIALAQISPNITQAITSGKADAGASRSTSLAEQVNQYIALEHTYPSTISDLVGKGYWRNSDNDNGFGGAFSFSIDVVKGVLTISTSIPDAASRAQYIGRRTHSFKPIDVGGGVVNATFIIPVSGALAAPMFSTKIPVSATVPSASANRYWYDISSGSAILNVSNGVSWSPTSTGTLSILPPTL